MVTIVQLRDAKIKLLILIKTLAQAIINVVSMEIHVTIIGVHALYIFLDIYPMIRIMIKMRNFVIHSLILVGLHVRFMLNRLLVSLL